MGFLDEIARSERTRLAVGAGFLLSLLMVAMVLLDTLNFGVSLQDKSLFLTLSLCLFVVSTLFWLLTKIRKTKES